MPTREQLTFERLEALIAMIKEEGVTQEGDPPPSSHLNDLMSTEGLGDADSIRSSHRDEAASDVEGVVPVQLRRDKISDETIESFRTSRKKENIQEQIDILFKILTGEEAKNTD